MITTVDALVLNEIRQLCGKYEEKYEPLELLRRISQVAELQIATIIWHDRLKQNQYEIFHVDPTTRDLSGDGKLLSEFSRIALFRTSHTQYEYVVEAELEFSMMNLMLNQPETDADTRKRYSGAASDAIRVKYEYSEVTFIENQASKTANDDKVRTQDEVIHEPSKTISLKISIQESPAAAFTPAVDFEMMTAGQTPAVNRLLLSGSKDMTASVGSNRENESLSESEQENDVDSERSDNDVEAVSDNSDPMSSSADYYSIGVSVSSLEKVVVAIISS